MSILDDVQDLRKRVETLEAKLVELATARADGRIPAEAANEIVSLRQQVADQAKLLREAHAAREVAQAHVRGLQRQLDNAPATTEIERLRRALLHVADAARGAAVVGLVVGRVDPPPPTPTPTPGSPT
jgi:chromosome segregation ATPase